MGIHLRALQGLCSSMESELDVFSKEALRERLGMSQHCTNLG